MSLNAAFEWHKPDNSVDEQVSVVVRMSPATARVLIDAPEPTDPVGQVVRQTLSAAENSGALVIPS